jgi:hypothetical protein
MTEQHIADSSRWDRRFYWATAVFAVALGLHAADHLRRGMSVVPHAVMVAGNVQIVAAVITVILVVVRNRWAPHAAIALGFASAVGFSAAHLLPTWGPFSDTFINPAPWSGVTWFSWVTAVLEMWVTAVLEIGAALVFAAVGLAVLFGRRAAESPPGPRRLRSTVR